MMGLPFVFIISLIIMAVIVIFAVMAIKNFTCRQEQITINLFVSDLRKSVEEAFYNAKGSQTIFEGTLPKGCSKIEFVCLGFPEEGFDRGWQQGLGIDDNKADDIEKEISFYKDTNYNFFFYPQKSLGTTGVSSVHNINSTGIPISLEKNPTCLSNKGKIELFLVNQGKNVLIKK